MHKQFGTKCEIPFTTFKICSFPLSFITKQHSFKNATVKASDL